MMRMMVGLMGREAFRSISSRVIPMMDSNTMARSSWFHLNRHTTISASQRINVCERFCIYASTGVPLFKKATQAESNEFKNGLDDENHGEDVIAVLQYLLEVLQDTHTHRHTLQKATVAVLYHCFITMVLGQVVEGVAMVTLGWL